MANSKQLKKLSAVAATGLLMIGIGGSTTPAAAAGATTATCNFEDHCYGIISWSHGNVAGAEVEIGTYKLAPTNPGGGANADMMTSEMWALFDVTNGQVHWWEFGAIHGGNWCNNNMSWFTATSRPGLGFVLQCHGAAAETNTKHVLRAIEDSDGNWSFYRNGSFVIAYGATPTNTNALQVGLETTDPNGQASMTGGKLKFRYQSTGQWANGWASTNYPAPPASSGTPCYSAWVSKPNDMRARCNIAATATTTPEVYPIKPPAAPIEEANRLAEAASVSPQSIKSIRMVQATEKAVLNNMHSSSPSDGDVTVIQAEGEFRDLRFPHPKGTSTPKGNYMTFVFDKATSEMQSVSITDKPVAPLESYGEVGTIK